MPRCVAACLPLIIGMLFNPEAAQAAQVNYVASTGRDSNPCTIIAPCRTLQHAIDSAPTGGEVQVLDSGNFGNATIVKSLAVSSDGETIFGSITVNNASAVVVLRGLDLTGLRTISTGVFVGAAAAVHIERCEIERFADHGIYVTASPTKLFVTDTISRDNGLSGLAINDENATPTDFGSGMLTVDNSTFENNATDGLLLSGGTNTIRRTTVSGNGASGIASSSAALNVSSTTATQNGYAGFFLQRSLATIESSAAQGNQVGLNTNSDPDADNTVTISNSIFANNTSAGIFCPNGKVQSLANNTVVDNGINVDGALTPLPGM